MSDSIRSSHVVGDNGSRLAGVGHAVSYACGVAIFATLSTVS